ncbi:MAG: universal stress protein [Gammaproteobacteria bacterium]|nr:universal stress protein [Gammaproteobacteria bacterium]NNJ51466.1 universal stress protein [Gammaproteobacteria bacterium]
MKNILVAIDSLDTSTISSPIMEITIELANAFSSKVKLLHVVPKSMQAPFNLDNKILRREVAHELHLEHEFFQQLAQNLRDKSIDATSLMVEGATIKTIQHESDRLNIDLIILGCHRHSELYGVLMNNTEHGMVSKCSHPIMFVPTH